VCVDGPIQSQPVISLQNNRPQAKNQVQDKGDYQPEQRQRTQYEPARNKNGAANKADQVDQFIQACPSLVLAKRLEA